MEGVAETDKKDQNLCPRCDVMRGWFGLGTNRIATATRVEVRTKNRRLLGLGQYVTRFDVETLLVGFAHAEGLTRKSANFVDSLEETRLVQFREQESDCVSSLHGIINRFLT